uniref:Uncharacterized protein n=1 Tax=Caenorhabditis japonica TaxID=281687 RepID=A0A8R1IV62_CAEJA
MCFMTFTGEKSGDIFDGFGDGNEGNAGDGGVNDKENERINSRAISFGSSESVPFGPNRAKPSFGILKSEDQVAFGKLKSPNM